MSQSEAQRISEVLNQVSEELSDLAIALLVDANHGDAEAAAFERRVTRARRAVEKATVLLAGSDDSID